jgi:two-component system nitrogen regulation sensor histidine kinase NtrY
MKSKGFALSVILQAIFLALSGTFALFVLIGDYLIITSIFFLVLWILQIIMLIWYVNKTNRELENFLGSIIHHDKVRLTGSGKSSQRLNLMYNKIIDVLRTERRIRETETQYFRETVEHIHTGLISYNSAGKIYMINGAAKQILRCGNCDSISQLGEVSSDLPHILESLEPGRPYLFTLNIDNSIVKLSLNLALLKIREEFIRLISLTDIRGELEAGELEAWQKLIRILTHEIVNSVTPINTLTTAMIGQLDKAGYPDSEPTRNLRSGFRAIQKRNKGLLAFVENFQKINKIPVPNFQPIGIKELFGNLQALLQKDLMKAEVLYTIVDDYTLEADEELLIQVLINLLKNSEEAGATKIEIEARIFRSERPRILIKDNGSGISEEHLDKVFVPFFSSKKQGSGIGLSLTRQIMRLHGGEISVSLTNEHGTSIVLNF